MNWTPKSGIWKEPHGDYGMELIPEELDRIAAQLGKGFERFRVLKRAGIKTWVNGAFTFTTGRKPLGWPCSGVGKIIGLPVE